MHRLPLESVTILCILNILNLRNFYHDTCLLSAKIVAGIDGWTVELAIHQAEDIAVIEGWTLDLLSHRLKPD